MSTARVYRRLSTYHNEDVVLLFRAAEFPDSLSLTVNFEEDRDEPLTVRLMANDTVPDWFTGETIKVLSSSAITQRKTENPPGQLPPLGHFSYTVGLELELGVG